MLNDEQHLVVPRRLFRGPRQRLLCGEQPVEAKIAGIREPVAKIGDDAGFEAVLRHDRCAWELSEAYVDSRNAASGGCRSVLRVPSQPATAMQAAAPTMPISHSAGFHPKGIWNTRSASA